MADNYTKEDVSDVHDNDVKITRAWSEDKSESFTIRELERQVVWIEEAITNQTAEKDVLNAKIAEAKKVLAE
jgi:hypothetical protein